MSLRKVTKEYGWMELRLPEEGAIVIGSGSTQVDVPKGSFIKCEGNNCNDFDVCPSGWRGSETPDKDCHSCPAGKTSYQGSLNCVRLKSKS